LAVALLAVTILFVPGRAMLAIADTAASLDPENALVMQLKYGAVTIRLRPDLAPKHVARIKELTRMGFYDGTLFHRVIPDFMAQGGDPTGTGRGGSGQKLPAEFTRTPHLRGTVSMARASDPDSADSQFFICFAPQPSLDGQYTVWGEVVNGMQFVDKLSPGEPPRNPDRIISMKVLADTRQ
jgi:peptidylprolyl isomerase